MAKLTKSEAGRLGALARIKKYGNPGTQEGRRKGGTQSVKVQMTLRNNFIRAKKHLKPRKSARLAEFLGILFGDGHLSKYQVSITTNSETDMDHAIYIKKIIKNLFGVSSNLRMKTNIKAVEVVTSSVSLVKWLSEQGMPMGNKIRGNLIIPNWIKLKDVFSKSFLRGVFDTDGCIYTDRHVIKGKVYLNQGWTITSYSDKFKSDIIDLLCKLNYRPTSRQSQKSVYLRKRKDIERYFKDIGTSNPKHLERYNRGRVPKRS